jgi:formylglycine-generating enzyme required for sulfatase activity
MRHLALASWLPLVAAAVLPPPARAVAIDWVHVGDPGNACDPQLSGCHGAVPSTYRISKHEVTNAAYAEFLNAKAATDPLALYSTEMQARGIARSGSPGNYTYSPIAGRGRMPVAYVSFYDALRFANWMHNGQGHGDTETGAYTLAGETPIPSNEPLTRNAGADVFIPTDAEWYKAAYYSTTSATYFDYPAGTNTAIVCSLPAPAPNVANCGAAVGDFTDVGSYTGSASPNGTLDQGGNVFEWTDEVPILENRTIRGGHAASSPEWLSAARREYEDPWYESSIIGFRVAAAAASSGEVTHLRASDPAATFFDWDPLPGGSGTVYDLARGNLSSLAGSASAVDLGPLTCVEDDSPDASSVGHPDTVVPAPGTAFFYLVRFQEGPWVGSWGFGSEGGERAGTDGCTPGPALHPVR